VTQQASKPIRILLVATDTVRRYERERVSNGFICQLFVIYWLVA